jgi:hypothetical protein
MVMNFLMCFFSSMSQTILGEDASMLVVMCGIENLGFRFSSMPLVGCLDGFFYETHGRVH